MSKLRYNPPSIEVIAFNNACASIEQLARTRFTREVQLRELHLQYKGGMVTLTEYSNAALSLGFQMQTEDLAHCFSLDIAMDLLPANTSWFEPNAARIRELFTVNLLEPLDTMF